MPICSLLLARTAPLHPFRQHTRAERPAVCPCVRLCKLVLRPAPFVALTCRDFIKPVVSRNKSTVCQAAQASATASLSGPRQRQRHAMLNDYIVTMPYGAAMAFAGVISLPLKGGWIGLLTALCGALLFTIGTMSHDKTTAGQESKSPLTLSAAAIAALLSRIFYNRAVTGVFGTMMATIVSAAVSLFLVYNVVLGGNKPQGGASATRKLTKSAKPTSNAPAVNEKQGGTRSWWNNTQSDDDQTELKDRPQEALTAELQSAETSASGLSSFAHPVNAQKVATVTGIVLYAQGVWGLWGEILGYSPASMTAAVGSGLMLIGAAQTVLEKRWQNRGR